MRSPEPGRPDVVVPPIRLPFTARLHPQSEEINRQTLQWLADTGLVRDEADLVTAERQRTGLTFAHALPDGSVPGCVLATQMCAYTMYVDDEITIERFGTGTDPLPLARHAMRASAVLADPDAVLPDEDRYIPALRDLCRRAYVLATPAQTYRLQRELLHLHLGFAAEAFHNLHETPPTPDEFLRIREATGAARLFEIFFELADGFEVPARYRHDPDVRIMRRHAARAFVELNELFSCARDASLGQITNLPAILAVHHAITLQEGVDLTAQRLHRDVAEFSRLAQQVRDRDTALPSLITAWENALSGVTAFHQVSTRCDPVRAQAGK